MKCFETIRAFHGDVGLYYRALGDKAVETHNPDLPLVAASIIKLPIMVTAFRDIAEGKLDADEIVSVGHGDKVPSCGALTYMHDGLEVTLSDLITLMIILSDNTATNLLIDRLTPDHVNRTMEALGIPGIALRRRLFDMELYDESERIIAVIGQKMISLHDKYCIDIYRPECEKTVVAILVTLIHMMKDRANSASASSGSSSSSSNG